MWRWLTAPFRLLWRLVDGIRRLLANLVLLLLVGSLALAWWIFQPPEVISGSVLFIAPEGRIVEAPTPPAPTDLLQGGKGVAEVALDDILVAIRRAASDSRIRALVIETDRLGPAGITKLSAVRDALIAFKASGKPVVARARRFNQAQYYLATAADKVFLAPDGYVLMQGLARYGTYYKRALDQLGVKVQVFRAGRYKSFVEPYTRTDMSPEDRAMTRELLDAVWAQLRTDVAAARKIPPSAVDDYVIDYRGQLAAAGGDPARMALDQGLVDQLVDDNEWARYQRDELGIQPGEGVAARTDLDAYLAATADWAPTEGGAIAVVTAQGAIVDGDGPPGTIGGDPTTAMLRALRDDANVRAVVIRIDSPGGSAFASEQIRLALQALREAGKPVLASMSSVAASGGYWIATGADEIWAAPLTLTGSIGVFGLFPDVSEPLGRLGLDVDGVATAPLAGALDPRRPLSEDARAALQMGVDHTYASFLARVSAARKLTLGEADAVAQGRVWTGQVARERGLVDQLGGLEQAVAAAARLAGLSAYHRVDAEAPLPLRLQMLQELLPKLNPAGGRSLGGAWMAQLQDALTELMHWNDPDHLYAHCQCTGITP